MPDPASVAQARALEVPVIVQGAKTVDGGDRRELFTENAKTTLVFDNGAVLNLKWKVVVGQVVLLHNEQNKKEILCHVMKAPAEGEASYTELQFTTADTDFWTIPDERPAVNVQTPEIAESSMPREPSEGAAEDSLAMMRESAPQVTMPAIREELVPAHEAVPETPEEIKAAPIIETSAPTGEDIDAALRQMSGAARAASPLEGADALAHPLTGAEPDHETDEKHLAAMIARDARFARYAALRERQAQELHREGGAKSAPDGVPAGEGEIDQIVVAPKVPLMERLTTGRNATYVTIAAGILVVVSLGFIWHALRGAFFPESDRSVAVTAPAKPAASSAPAPPAQKSASAAAATTHPATTPEPSPAISRALSPSISNAPRPVAAPARAVPAPKVAAATPAEVHSGDVAPAQSKGRKPTAENVAIIPAKILMQPQPPYPSWANRLDLDGVVVLDAVIDETGNLAETKVLSGPRPLQHAAEQAIELWQFEPARFGGKPVATHIVLTVEFKR